VVPVTGAAAGATVIHISAAAEIAARTVNVTVLAPAAITLSDAVAPLGQSVAFPVTLGTPAPPSGVTVSLGSSKPLTVSVSPSSVFIAGGATTPAVQARVNGVNIGAASVTASAPGYASATRTVIVPATLTISPSSLTMQPGTMQKLLVALSDSAPWGPDTAPWSNGLTIQLASSNPAVATVPATVDFYPDGSSFTTVVVMVRAVGPGTAVIRASALPFIPEVSATVTVLPQ
jgi:hypothetical protein